MLDLPRSVDPIAYAWARVNPAHPLPAELNETAAVEPVPDAQPPRASNSEAGRSVFWTAENDAIVRSEYLDARAGGRLPELSERLKCARAALDRRAVVLGVIEPIRLIPRIVVVRAPIPVAPMPRAARWAALPVRRPVRPSRRVRRNADHPINERIRRDYASYRGRLRDLAAELRIDLGSLYVRANRLGVAGEANAAYRNQIRAREARILAEYPNLTAEGRNRLAAELGVSLEVLRRTAHKVGASRSFSSDSEFPVTGAR